MDLHRLADLLADQSAGGRPYLEFIRNQHMSVGLYVLHADATDHQQPHREDEIYVVLSGRSQFTAGDEVRDVQPTDVIYVPAALPHRFHDISEEMQLIVVFAPAESLP